MTEKNILIEELFDRGNLSTRIWNALYWENIKTIDDLKFYDDKKLLSLPNFGKKCLEDLRSEMTKRGIEYYKILPDINISVLTVGQTLEDDNGVKFKLIAMADGYCMVQKHIPYPHFPVVVTIATAIQMLKRSELAKK